MFAYGQGGDKAQMAVDRSGTASDGHVYLVWRDCLAEKCFVRSTDRGASFQPPLAIPSTPTFGTMRVGNDGELYLAGRLEPPEFDPEQPDRNLHRHLFSRSLNARDPAQIPTFDSREVDLGGLAPLFLFKQNPNQYGPVGDVQVGVDASTGAMRGQLYLLATVDPPGEDNLDISFVRSLDGGDSWSAPVRINDDGRSQHHWNWFGMMGVAPNSRIDAVWYDTRDSASYKVSRLYYSYSWDGGQTWSKNVPVSPAFDTTLAIRTHRPRSAIIRPWCPTPTPRISPTPPPSTASRTCITCRYSPIATKTANPMWPISHSAGSATPMPTICRTYAKRYGCWGISTPTATSTRP
uniref:sialidase family protein n=1 Tax=Methylomonas koyamae TaxID=702114 RepID=UPI000B01CE78